MLGRQTYDDMKKKGLLTSNQLMEAVRKLDYKVQYKVCDKLYQIMFEDGFCCDEDEMLLLFHDEFLEINPNNLEGYMVQLHRVVNYMDNVLYEMDVYEPETFMSIERRLRNLV